MFCGRLTPDLDCIYQALQDLSLPTINPLGGSLLLVEVIVSEGCRVAACLGIGCLASFPTPWFRLVCLGFEHLLDGRKQDPGCRF